MTATKDNDWTCRQCGNKNWYKRGYCIGGNNKCLTPRDSNWVPGDWYCACGNHNLKKKIQLQQRQLPAYKGPR